LDAHSIFSVVCFGGVRRKPCGRAQKFACEGQKEGASKQPVENFCQSNGMSEFKDWDRRPEAAARELVVKQRCAGTYSTLQRLILERHGLSRGNCEEI
jgi:hypothetical protein